MGLDGTSQDEGEQRFSGSLHLNVSDSKLKATKHVQSVQVHMSCGCSDIKSGDR